MCNSELNLLASGLSCIGLLCRCKGLPTRRCTYVFNWTGLELFDLVVDLDNFFLLGELTGIGVAGGFGI